MEEGDEEDKYLVVGCVVSGTAQQEQQGRRCCEARRRGEG